MAVGTTNAMSGPFTTNGATVAFPFTFTALSTDDVTVISRDADGADTTVSPGLYTVTLGASSGGTVTFDTAPASGASLYVLLDPGMEQETEFEQGGRYLASAVNAAFDRAALRDQALRRDIDRALVFPVDSDVTAPAFSFSQLNEMVAAGFVPELAQLASNVAFVQAGANAVARDASAKLRESVSITDFGASSDATAATNTAAIQAAMSYLMDRFDGEEDFYPANHGEPASGAATQFERRDRRTGRIYIPAGRYLVSPEVFSSLVNDRAPYVGFDFFGDGMRTSVFELVTGGAEAWFYKTSAGQERYQSLTFNHLGFTTDDLEFGNFAKVYSTGGPKQFMLNHCHVRNIQTYMHTQGTGNADLNRTVGGLIEHYGSLLILDNDQSVQHDFVGTHLRSWGSQVDVREHGGGNVNISNAFIDLIWDERVSPAGGNFFFEHSADASIGAGNCTYKWSDCRVEVEAYKIGAGAPPFGLVKTVENLNAFPRIVFDNVNFVSGETYTIDSSGAVSGSGEFRRITAFQMWPGKHVEIHGGVLLKTFFYTFSGSRESNGPPNGGIITIRNAYDGILGELPAADSALSNIHARVTYNGSAGRLITEGMTAHTTGPDSFHRSLIDADPRGPTNSFGREPSCSVKRVFFKHTNNGWPSGTGGNEHYLDLPPGLTDARIYVKKPASGAVTDTYQIHLKANTRAGALIVTGAESTLAQFKDAHTIDLSHVDLTGISRICLCASGTATEFQEGGIAYIEYV